MVFKRKKIKSKLLTLKTAAFGGKNIKCMPHPNPCIHSTLAQMSILWTPMTDAPDPLSSTICNHLQESIHVAMAYAAKMNISTFSC